MFCFSFFFLIFAGFCSLSLLLFDGSWEHLLLFYYYTLEPINIVVFLSTIAKKRNKNTENQIFYLFKKKLPKRKTVEENDLLCKRNVSCFSHTHTDFFSSFSLIKQKKKTIWFEHLRLYSSTDNTKLNWKFRFSRRQCWVLAACINALFVCIHIICVWACVCVSLL